MYIKALVKRHSYFDSIALMRIARQLRSLPGIDEAAVIMGTEANLHQLQEAHLAPRELTARADDLVIAVRGQSEQVVEQALQEAETLLVDMATPRQQSNSGIRSPRSLEQALREQSEAGLVVISVPGMYATLEAEQALRAGRHVFLFSDNVPIEDEIALKKLALQQNVLLMGPDCGTAMLNGVGLGFVNVVPRGPIGIVGASGTGIQQVMSLIAQGGSGVSQVIGCGGRDLSTEVGGITTLQGLRLLQEDEQTKVIVLISKPPAPEVAERVLNEAVQGSKPVIVMFVGADYAALQQKYGRQVVITCTLAEAAQKALHACSEKYETRQLTPIQAQREPQTAMADRASSERSFTGQSRDRFMVGLFSGGTLCDEAVHIWEECCGPIYSNIAVRPALRLKEGQKVHAHYALDFGADEYTRGRAHPMIDPTLRLKKLQKVAKDPQVAVIILDIVLGYCAHPDPASVYAPAIATAREQAQREGRKLHIVISLCGTEGDIQRLSVQKERLLTAGAEVFTSNAEAAMRCIDLLQEESHA